jgi:hypothetical protein
LKSKQYKSQKMKTKMKTLIRLSLAFITLGAAFLITSCSSEGTSRLEVRLTDAPGDYEAVNIDIQGVQVNSSDGNTGWVSLDIEEGVYDIRQLTNGLDTLLGSIELPAGRIEQIRLILGENNTVTIDGETYDLTTPSSQQSGLKLNLHADLAEGITYTVVLDFDAAQSVVERGNGLYSLKPVIRAIEESTSGAIKGMVTPIDAMPAVYAIAGSDTVATAFADSTSGNFLVRGLPAGTYTVSIVPQSAYVTINQTGVVVTVGNVTDLGTIEF